MKKHRPIATVINNNQPGWTNIIETEPNITLDVGTQLVVDDGSLSLVEFQRVNAERCLEWHKDNPWTMTDWAIAMGGESGEVLNILKKLKRLDDGIVTDQSNREELIAALGEELADTVMYLSLMATHSGLDLQKIIIDKFNKVSERYGFPQRL